MKLAVFLATLVALFCLASAAPNPHKPDCTTKKLSTSLKSSTKKSSTIKTSTSHKPSTTHKTSTSHKPTTSHKTSTSRKTSTSSTKRSSASTKTTKTSSAKGSTSSKVSSTSRKSTTSAKVTSSIKTTTSIKTTSTSSSETLSTSTTSKSDIPSTSIPVISTPSISVPSVTLPSVTLPVTSEIPTEPSAGCVPATGEAIMGGGFADAETADPFYTPFVFTQGGAANIYPSYSTSFGLVTDTGNTNAFVFSPGGGAATFSLSQTVCLIVGQPYTFSYHLGISAALTPSSTGCNVGLSTSDGQILVPQVPVCGGIANAPDVDNGTPGDFGTCTEPSGRFNGFYQLFTGPYVPTSDQITFSITGTCVDTFNQENPRPGLIDLVSLAPSI